MSQAQFDKAVAIVQNLPKDGPIQPSQDDKLFVRARCGVGLMAVKLTRPRCSSTATTSRVRLALFHRNPKMIFSEL